MGCKYRKYYIILLCSTILFFTACTNEFGYEEDKVYSESDLGDENFVRERFDGFTNIQEVLEEGKRVIKEIYNVDLSKEVVRQEINLETWDSDYYWNVQWILLDENGDWTGEITLNVDAEEGEINQLYISDITYNEYYLQAENGYLDDSFNVTYDEAKELIWNFMKVIGKDNLKEYPIVYNGTSIMEENYILKTEEENYYFSIMFGEITWFNKYYGEEVGEVND